MISDEMLKKLIAEEEMALIERLPDTRCCKHEFSPAFEENMKKLIEKTDNPPNYRILKRVACIFISFILSVGLLFGSRVEAEASLLDWIKAQFEGVYHYFFALAEDPEEVQSYYLGWVPDGYELIDSYKISYGENVIYRNNKNELLYFYCVHGSKANSLFEGNGEYEYKTVKRKGLRAELLLADEDNRTSSITWKSDDGNIVFNVTGYLSEKELIKIAQNVKIQK